MSVYYSFMIISIKYARIRAPSKQSIYAGSNVRVWQVIWCVCISLIVKRTITVRDRAFLSKCFAQHRGQWRFVVWGHKWGRLISAQNLCQPQLHARSQSYSSTCKWEATTRTTQPDCLSVNRVTLDIFFDAWCAANSHPTQPPVFGLHKPAGASGPHNNGDLIKFMFLKVAAAASESSKIGKCCNVSQDESFAKTH